MFFSITLEPDTRFLNRRKITEQHWFNSDPGWTWSGSFVYKGYADQISIDQIPLHFDQCNNYTGNFCVINFDRNVVTVRHNRNRSFELWHDSNTVTNLPPPQGRENIWASHEIVLDTAQHLIPIATDNRPVTGKLTWNQALDQVLELLKQNIQEFVATNQPRLKLYLSGGIDTLMLYSLLTRLHVPFELITATHYDQDEFTTRNHEALNYFWNYKQIHHWRDAAWLATGSHGDEYFLRGPEVIAMLTSWHDIDFLKIMQANPNAYHAYYFRKYETAFKTAWDNRQSFQKQYPRIELLHAHILDFLINDYQYYHLGNTLTWTPFRNIELVRILLQVPVEELLPQFISAEFSRQIVACTDPVLLNSLSQFKNYNSTENLWVLLKTHTQNQ
jgi:hypothetical protein